MVKEKKVNYLSNARLLVQVEECHKQGKLTDELAGSLMLLCNRLGTKGQFYNYTYLDEMKARALLRFVTAWKKFDVTKSQNPFAFFTQVAKNEFIAYLNIERRSRDIRDSLLVQSGLTPSYTYQEANTPVDFGTEVDYNTD